MKWCLYFCIGWLIVGMTSCKKESFITGAGDRISFSADTLKFDTVFTTLGSTTRMVKVKNENDQKLMLSSIRLMGGNQSPFKTNINGTPTPEMLQLEVAANDSIYIYVVVTIDPTQNNLPFLVTDSIEIKFNNQTRYIQLEAYGQNANFITHQTINSTQVWNHPLPFVVLGSLTVRETGQLTLSPGTRMYVRATAPIIIQGTLITNGTRNRPVVFRGERIDEYYRDLPGSWPGIVFTETSKNNVLTFTELHNALNAITVNGPSVNAQPKLNIRQCVINNAFESGLLLTETDAEVTNSLISNCASNIRIQKGGNYNFIHCTVASMTNRYFFRQTPVLSLANYLSENGQISVSPLNAAFTNSIFWGNSGFIQNEIELWKDASAGFGVTFQHCLYRMENAPAPATNINCISNTDPQFSMIDQAEDIFDFRIGDPLSPVIDQGILTGLPKDLDDNERNVGLPDLGAYEKQ